MITIEVTKRRKQRSTMSYEQLNTWLRKRAAHMVVACYYTDGRFQSVYYEFIDGNNDEVPAERDGMELERVVL